jgi:hypothetical protein
MCAAATSFRELSIEQLTDAELLAVAASGLPEHKEDGAELLLPPPGPKSKPGC